MSESYAAWRMNASYSLNRAIGMIQYAERLLEPRVEKDPRVEQLDYAIGILRQVRDYIESGSDVIEDMIARDVIMNELRNLPR